MRSSGGNGHQTNIAIRGISSTIGASTTGIYINDTPIQIRNIGGTAAYAYPLIFDREGPASLYLLTRKRPAPLA